MLEIQKANKSSKLLNFKQFISELVFKPLENKSESSKFLMFCSRPPEKRISGLSSEIAIFE